MASMEGSAEEREKSELRAKVRAIHADSSLSPSEKSRRVQELMMPKSMLADASAPEVTAPENEFEVSWHNEAEQIMGCKHYQRKCKKRAPCCGFLYPCRLCHDEQSDHAIDRFKVTEVWCMVCKTLQPVGGACSNCNTVFASYYCSFCKFWSDDPNKHIFHCDQGCSICRVGRREDYIHCERCSMCLHRSGFDDHVCVRDKLRSNCPVCHEGMFNSIRRVSIFERCGHVMHEDCFTAYVETSLACPLCSKSLYKDMSSVWEHYDALLQIYQMPPEYASARALVLCNDCGERSTVPFHFQAMKCGAPGECGSYNTRVISTENMPNGIQAPITGAEPAAPNSGAGGAVPP
eukprot:Amastigsp_a175225_370.p1 type:complete len:348 gc:universal Amastigsp_a175225_370:1103-60(-)